MPHFALPTKNRSTVKNYLKVFTDSSLQYAFSNNSSSSQTQSDATVPLMPPNCQFFCCTYFSDNRLFICYYSFGEAQIGSVSDTQRRWNLIYQAFEHLEATSITTNPSTELSYVRGGGKFENLSAILRLN